MILEISDKERLENEITSFRAKLGLRIAFIRTSKEISQFRLSLLTGLSKQYISDLENGRRNVSISSLYKVAKGLEVGIEELFLDLEQTK